MNAFWQLRRAGLLSPETRNYVPAVLAAMRLLGPEEHVDPMESETQNVHSVVALSHATN